MAILGITNRTENWKTARHFAPLSEEGTLRLAKRLLIEEEGRDKLRLGDVRLELFWRGMRDHLHKEEQSLKAVEDRLAAIYRNLFRQLRGEVEAFGQFQALKEWNYDVSDERARSKLANNLRNTEIDIVLASQNHLFIGEAKSESKLRGDSKLVLPHQLIRQYVMASILLELRGDGRTVVPFVVGPEGIGKQREVLFMCQQKRSLEQKWLRKENVLTWSDIEALR